MHSERVVHARMTLTAKPVYRARCAWIMEPAAAPTVKNVTAVASAAMAAVAATVTLLPLNPNVPMAKPVLQGGVSDASYAKHWADCIVMQRLNPG